MVRAMVAPMIMAIDGDGDDGDNKDSDDSNEEYELLHRGHSAASVQIVRWPKEVRRRCANKRE